MKKWAGWLTLIMIVAVTVELTSFAIYKIILVPRAAFLVYTPPPLPDQASYEQYLARRDPIVGWPNKQDGPMIGRPSPALPQGINICLSLYGDSFVYASEVSDADAWGNLLAEQLQCPVANYGVGGYGTDQAYLRFTQNEEDEAPFTILGIYPQNLLRNVNQYRFLLTGGEVNGFKPRFVLDDGQLRLLPLPEIAYTDLPALYANPEQWFTHESFLPDSAYGPARFQFPYTWSLIQLVARERTRNWLINRPSWSSFVQPDHPTQSLEITMAITTQFKADCQERNKHCMMLVFPTPNSYEWFQDNGGLATQTLITDLQAAGLPVLDLTAGIADQLGDTSFCTIVTQPDICEGHFNETGNRLLANVVYQFLQDEKLMTAD